VRAPTGEGLRADGRPRTLNSRLFCGKYLESPYDIRREEWRAPVQMTFEERRRLTRAGKKKKRPGPKPGSFPNVRHRTRAVHKYWNPLHVTMRAVRGLPSFRAQTLFAAFERAVRRTRRDDFRVVEFSVQDDHLHLIVEADDNIALERGMKSFSVRANRLFNAAHGRGRGRVWGRPLPPSRSHERAPGAQRARLTASTTTRSTMARRVARRVSTCARRRVGSRVGLRSGSTTTVHVRPRKRAPCSCAKLGRSTASSIRANDHERRADPSRQSRLRIRQDA